MRSGEVLSMYFVNDRSCTLTFPAPWPPPMWALPELDAPQLQARTSISPACDLSFDSPLKSPILMNMSTAMVAAPAEMGGGIPRSPNAARSYETTRTYCTVTAALGPRLS